MTNNLRIVIIGLGTQGVKRKATLGKLCSGTVDPISVTAEYRKIEDVPLENYDAAFVCTPDAYKLSIIEYLVSHGKHVLCEKPLSFSAIEDYVRIENLTNQNNVKIYTAYNHRFEPSITKLKAELGADTLGKIYQIRIFYGNGTAKLVSKSGWRDSGLGVISDLGSHCVDLICYWFPEMNFSLKVASVDTFENNSPDSALLISEESNPRISIEISHCCWENTFRAEIIGEYGNLSIYGLTKWSTSQLVKQIRIFPSGIPIKSIENYEYGDKTWDLEHDYFYKFVSSEAPVDLKTDKFIFKVLALNLGSKN